MAEDNGQILLYQTPDGESRIEVRLQGETVWLSLDQMAGICFVIGAAFTAWSFWWKGVPGQMMETPMLEWSWEFCTPNVALATFGAFLLFSCIRKAPAWINGLAKLTFGMYLMHIFFLYHISQWLIGGDVANPLLPVWLAIPTIGLLSFICCAITTKLLSLLPGSKYIVGC